MKYPQLVSMPSAVSDWLEEQLEARGIDAVVYTHYILSLLHSDVVDVIYSDEDLHCSHLKKEVRRSGGSRKRVRRTSDWWKYAQADAERIKRSAAVECLMSASDQTCGIESLIDELCEKLNEIKSDPQQTVKKSSSSLQANQDLHQVSPQELAKRYYAAFPPLDRNSSTSPSKLISLIPKWLPSPKKKTTSNNRTKQQARSHDDNMKASRFSGKQRYGAYFTNRNSNHRKEPEWKKSRSDPVPKQEEAWMMDEDANMYDDLPVDIKELLDDSPTPHDVTVEMMNLANMRDTGRRGFIPCGTNITSSIWTNEAAMEEDSTLFNNNTDLCNYNSSISDSVLGFQFSSINITNCKSDWSVDDFGLVAENEHNVFLENSSLSKKNVWNLPNERWSEDSGCFEDDHAHYSLSLVKLNHLKETSAFAEVKPKARARNSNLFSKIIGSGLQRDDLKTVEVEKEKDDLLTSVRSHFKPINEKTETLVQDGYADGATFVVSTSWDKITYRRTESGMYIESDYSMRKKYCEYKSKTGTTSDVDFVLKYLVCQNDKGCQTEDADAEVEAINLMDVRRRDAAEEPRECTCQTLVMDMDHSLGGDCQIHQVDLYEGWGRRACDKCNNNTTIWNTKSGFERDVEWQFGTVSKIWSGGVVCHACLGRPPSTLQHSKLREDVSQDGDQLLSDLSTVQKSYMLQDGGLPPTEFTCDLSQFLSPKERKRRRSLVALRQSDDDVWSFASRLEEDCLIQMSTLPTLRSVTL